VDTYSVVITLITPYRILVNYVAGNFLQVTNLSNSTIMNTGMFNERFKVAQQCDLFYILFTKYDRGMWKREGKRRESVDQLRSGCYC